MTIEPEELAALGTAGTDYLLLDVRTDQEFAIASLEGSTLIPLHELESRVNELEAWRERRVVCMCHHGMRSAAAQDFLRAAGFQDVLNLWGGIDAYSAEVDPRIPRYD